MNPVLAAALGLAAGLVVGFLVAWVMRRRPSAAPAPTVTPLCARVLEALRCAGMLINNVDEVVAVNDPALDFGLVRGDRVAVPALLELVREVRRTGEDAAVNLDQTRARRATLQLAVRVVSLDDGQVLVVADDRGAALRVQASARDFMANATHELKTPIGAITLLAEAVEQSADDPEGVVRFTQRIQSESARLAQLVAQIVQLSRLQGDPVSALERVDIDEVVGLVLDHARQIAEQRQVNLITGSLSGQVVRGNRTQLVTALGNLVENAITYSDPKARVVITTRPVTDAEGEWVAIAVSDNGIGIGEDDQKRVFERFYRVDYARSRQTGGSGLGLSIVHEIVEGHDGDVTLWSRLGSGSTFTVTLPAAPAEEGETT